MALDVVLNTSHFIGSEVCNVGVQRNNKKIILLQVCTN